MENFPPNSHRSRAGSEPKNVQRVTTTDAVRRRKPLGTQFRQTFFNEDGRTAMSYVFSNVLIPLAKDMLVESSHAWVDRVFYGNYRRGPRGGGGPVSGPQGHFNYNAASRRERRPDIDDRPPMPRMLSRRARSTHDFGEIVLASRPEATDVIDQMNEILATHEFVTVADLYVLTGLQTSHTDTKWGWTDLRGANIGRVRGGGGYLLQLPEPELVE
jgi:hypothetical protein